ncbi:hypothetical protein V1514DRAFT_319388 [Lipomyces japonicus]|uniref:uncharacterized protein n=1 Tax=Lipomyces japonicus TaxID=56871 RepID=UPI0034CF5DE6
MADKISPEPGPAPVYRRAVSPKPGQPISTGPLEMSINGQKILTEQLVEAATTEIPLSLDQFISPHIFKQLPPAVDISAIELADLTSFTTQSLLARSTLYATANASKSLIIESNPTDHKRILHLWLLRLSSLCLLGLPASLEAEGQALQELTVSDLFRNIEGHSIVPWNLRLILIRTQTQSNGQLGVAKYYGMAREARIESWKAREKKDIEGLKLWKSRLQSCGIYVAAMLAHIKDFPAAFDHVNALYSSAVTESEKTQISQITALLCLESGDGASAADWFAKLPTTCPDPLPETPTTALSQSANLLATSTSSPSPSDLVERLKIDDITNSGDGDEGKESLPTLARHISEAGTSFEESKSLSITGSISGNGGQSLAPDGASKCNLALAYLYDGKIETARTLFQELVVSGFRFAGLVLSFCAVDALTKEVSSVLT